MNLNGHAAGYPLDRWADDIVLVTDFAVHLGSHPDETQLYRDILKQSFDHNPRIVIGRYLSGARVQSTFSRFPPEAVHADLIPKAWLRPGTDRVDLEIKPAADAFADAVIAEFRDHPRPVLFLDNLVHPSSLRGWIAWQDTCGFLRRVRTATTASHAALIANVAVASWAMSDEDAALLAESVDGIALEMPFHQSARQSASAIHKQARIYRRWLDQGKILVLIAVDRAAPTETQRVQEVGLVAAFAMMIREPEDQIFVAWPFFKAPPDWADWPAKFGPPRGRFRLDDASWEMVRAFENGTLSLNTATKAVAFTAAK